MKAIFTLSDARSIRPRITTAMKIASTAGPAPDQDQGLSLDRHCPAGLTELSSRAAWRLRDALPVTTGDGYRSDPGDRRNACR